MTRRKLRRYGHLLAVAASCTLVNGARAEPAIEFERQPGTVRITAAGEHVASYYYQDREITRPFLAHVHAPGGVQVTRNHPPRPGQDDTDHGTAGNYFHPGLWLAFSDLNGNDYWRLKAAVRHEAFVDEPAYKDGRGTFSVRNSYRDQQHAEITVANEVCRYTIVAWPQAYALVCDSLFWADDRPLVFGDQEEMGFGLRVATPLAVKHGGRLLDSAGRLGEKLIRGQEAAWCDYSGTIDGQHVGIMLVPDPANPLRSRYHARDYGFVAANPFGSKVFGAAEERKTVIEPGNSLRLRFAVVLHSGAIASSTETPPADSPAATAEIRPADTAELAAFYDSLVKLLADLPRPNK